MPSLLSMLFGAALLFECLRFGYTTLHALPATNVPGSAPSINVGADTGLAALRSLFGAIALPSELHAAPGSLSLRGTIALGDPTRGFAIISISGAAGLYAVGADLGGAVLHEVYADHVVLDRNGAFESLEMTKPDRDFVYAGNASAPGGSSGSDDATPYRPPSAEELRERVAVATAPLAAVIKAHPLMNGGDYRALVVEPGSDAETFRRLGLRPGDQIMAVNDKHVTPETFDVLAKDIKAGRKVRLYINRAGDGPEEITLNAAAVATAARE
ncbi:MAG: hypothetical protein NTZ79_14730 [Proteobacteria bacterium]|nr:hypothetical protein [Pseudomonadota bacterium]